MIVVDFEVLESQKKFQVIPPQNLACTQFLAKGIIAGNFKIQQQHSLLKLNFEEIND